MYYIILCVILCIILILCVISVDHRENYSDSTDSVVDIDSLVYDKKEHFPDKKNRVIETFQLPLPLQTFQGPSKNSSAATKKELKYISQLTHKRNAEHSKLAAEIEGGGTLKYFIKFAGTNGLMYDQVHLKKITKDVNTLAYLIKSYYNRPRPYQLGFLLNYNINPIAVAKTSSYPCERTLLAKVLAYQLSYNNQNYKDQLHAIAKQVELSRYYAGLNYPSDTMASLRIADILRDKMKYLEASTSTSTSTASAASSAAST